MRQFWRKTLLIMVLSGLSGLITQTVSAQDTGQSEQPADRLTEVEYAYDTGSIDQIILAVYDVISGPAGERREWSRFRALMHPEARLIPSGADGAEFMNAEDYIQRTDQFFFENGFFEQEIARRTERFGNIAHVFSTYTSKRALDEAPFAMGINSIQLVFEQDRWWVISIFWQGETDDFPLPPVYLEP